LNAKRPVALSNAINAQLNAIPEIFLVLEIALWHGLAISAVRVLRLIAERVWGFSSVADISNPDNNIGRGDSY
jgi:hypothetical protein